VLAAKRWRVWHESHFPSSRPMRWHPPHPFSPSMIGSGWAPVLGMAFVATQATACSPLASCFTWSGWQATHDFDEPARRIRRRPGRQWLWPPRGGSSPAARSLRAAQSLRVWTHRS
jgi:hypothetical protein